MGRRWKWRGNARIVLLKKPSRRDRKGFDSLKSSSNKICRIRVSRGGRRVGAIGRLINSGAVRRKPRAQGIFGLKSAEGLQKLAERCVLKRIGGENAKILSSYWINHDA